ncbi:MAG: 2OG-Fe(II) oxygenase [Gammaproteobacteria bacterium]
MSTLTTTKRNDPCPCESGLRFKHCCGGSETQIRRLHDDPPTLVLNDTTIAGKQVIRSAASRRVEHHGILMIEDFLSAGRCAQLVEMSRGLLSRRGRVLVVDETGGRDLVDKDAQTRITTTIKTFDIAEAVIPIVKRAFLGELRHHYGVEFEWFEFPDILRYDPGGHYAEHNDSEVWDLKSDSWRLAEDRQYSVLIYLNSEFAGGAVHFPEFDFTVQPKPGLLLAFPSDHRYKHAALPVESGTRYVIVSWGAVVGAKRALEGARLGVVYASGEHVPQALQERQ